jgi:carbonic anhydrase
MYEGSVDMNLLDEVMTFNQVFVANGEYKPYATSNLPNKKLAIITCMDTRLLELLPKAMNFHNGDVKVIKTAGAIIRNPWDSTVSSLLIAIYDLGVEEVCLIGHHSCGMSSVDIASTLAKMKARGISEATLDTLSHAGIDLEKWLAGFQNVSDSVLKSVEVLRNHPLLPEGIPVHGLVINPQTGELEVVTSGYKEN